LQVRITTTASSDGTAYRTGGARCNGPVSRGGNQRGAQAERVEGDSGRADVESGNIALAEAGSQEHAAGRVHHVLIAQRSRARMRTESTTAATIHFANRLAEDSIALATPSPPA
jgi:hypothetical protein